MGDIHPVITRSQHAYGERILKNLSRREIALAQCIAWIDELLSPPISKYDPTPDTSEKTEVIAANTGKKIDQAALLSNHEDMIEALDSYALSMCYLLKTRNFIPYLIKTYGATYDYEIGINDKLQSHAVNLLMFSGNGEKAVQKLWSHTTMIYDYLSQIRDKMDDKTLTAVINENKASEFLKGFCQGRPPELQDSLGRMEYLFFREHNIPLGLFADAPQHVLKWIQRQNYDAVTSKHKGRMALTFRHLNKFPGIVCFAGKKVSDITTNGKFSLAQRLIGTIPKEGVIIELDDNTTEQFKPRLVR